MLLGVVIARESKAIHELVLLDGVEGLDVGIFFRRGHMCKLLASFECLQHLAHLVGDELRTVVVSDDDTLQREPQVEVSHEPNYIRLPDAPLEQPTNNFATEHVHDGQLIIPTPFAQT